MRENRTNKIGKTTESKTKEKLRESKTNRKPKRSRVQSINKGKKNTRKIRYFGTKKREKR